MSDLDFTPETRVTRLREWVHMKSTPASASILRSGSNILLGAAMHVMARRGNGASELTEIEKMAVDFFDVMADSEEERDAYSQVCSEAKNLARAGAFAAAKIPNSIMALSDDAPYTTDKFAEYFKQLAEETIAQPHIRAVTP